MDKTAETTPPPYDPRTFRALTFHDAVAELESGADTPRAYLERCLETIEAREPLVQAFAALNLESARAAADESSRRWADRRPLSAIDGMPVGIKDLLETVDMPTEMGCAGLRGNFPKRDNAAVAALRQAGAVILGKTVTAELGGTHPGPTGNPFDPARTPGGSSTGSAAAVAAGMLPAAIGSQVGGSIIRPASFCGNVALKPSQGAINRGERQTTSQSTHGVHAGAIEDMWRVAIEIAARAGGDRGAPGLRGPASAPTARRPDRLAVLETAGWEILDEASRAAFEAILEQLRGAGITLLRRGDAPEIEALERAVAEAGEISTAITRWENRWSHRGLANLGPDAISPRAQQSLEKAEAMTAADYRALLHRREEAQLHYARLRGLADAVVTLASPGPAPLKPQDAPGQPLARFPTGDAVFNYPSSMLFAPVVTVPLIGVAGLPLGVQAMGQPGEDVTVTAIARWMLGCVPPVVID